MKAFLRRPPFWAVWLLCFVLPVSYYAWMGITGGLGPDPVEIWHHESGQLAVWVLLVTLSLSHIRYWASLSLLGWRRHLGLVSFGFALVHLGVWMLDQGAFSRMLEELYKRPHIIVGAIAVGMYLPLVITSTNNAVRRMGASWRRLHLLVHPLLFMVVLHHAMSLKTYWEAELGLQLALAILLWASKGWIWNAKRLRVQRS